MLHTILNFLASLFSALSRAADASTSDSVSTVDTQSAAPPGWEGAPPYRYIDVSRYQGKITLFQHHLTRRTQVDPVRFAVNVGEAVNGVCEIFDLYVHAVHICMKSFLMSHFIW